MWPRDAQAKLFQVVSAFICLMCTISVYLYQKRYIYIGVCVCVCMCLCSSNVYIEGDRVLMLNKSTTIVFTITYRKDRIWSVARSHFNKSEAGDVGAHAPASYVLLAVLCVCVFVSEHVVCQLSTRTIAHSQMREMFLRKNAKTTYIIMDNVNAIMKTSNTCQWSNLEFGFIENAFFS